MKNNLQRMKSSGKYRIISLVALLILPIYIYSQLHGLFHAWKAMPEQALLFSLAFLNLSLLGIFALLIFSGIPLSIHIPFLSKDLPLLSSLPLHRAEIWSAKFIYGFLVNASLFLYFGLPLILAFFISHALPWWSLFFILLAAIAFLALAYAIANIFAILFLALLSANRARYITTMIVALVFISIWAAFQFIRVSRLNPTTATFDANALQWLAEFRNTTWLILLPSHWLTRLIGEMVQNRIVHALQWLFILGATTLTAIAAGFLLSQKLYKYKNGHFFPIPKKETPSPAHKVSQNRPAVVSVIQKDIKIIIRDVRQFSQNLIFLIMLLILPFIIYEKKDLISIVDYHPFVSLLLFSALFSAISTAKLVAIEGKSFLYLKNAPLSGKALFISKWLVGYAGFLLPAAASLLLLCWLSSVPLVTFLVFLVMIFLMLGKAVATGVAIAAYFVNFDWDHPRNMLQTGGNFWLMLAVIIIVAPDFILLALGHVSDHVVLPMLLALGYALTIFLLGTYITRKKLEKMEWIY